MAVDFKLNDKPVSVDVPDGTLLLWVLRERLNEMHVKLMPTPNPPTGVGQMATPLLAPAIAGAVHSLTGKRLRQTPFIAERVLASL